MALLEKVMGMQQQGFSEPQIINALREEGISMKQISETLSQARIKSAIYPSQNETQGMEQSISPDQEAPMPQQFEQPAQQSPQEQYPQNQQEQYAYPQEQNAYPPEQYGQQYQGQEVYYQQGVDLETAREIAKQEIEDSMKNLSKEIESISKSKTDLKFQMQNIESRLQKIEAVMQELQSAIIRKIGDYGEAISSISEELKATQNSFSKLINPVLDNKRGIKAESISKKSSKKGKLQPEIREQEKNSASFEDYFR